MKLVDKLRRLSRIELRAVISAARQLGHTEIVEAAREALRTKRGMR